MGLPQQVGRVTPMIVISRNDRAIDDIEIPNTGADDDQITHRWHAACTHLNNVNRAQEPRQPEPKELIDNILVGDQARLILRDGVTPALKGTEVLMAFNLFWWPSSREAGAPRRALAHRHDSRDIALRRPHPSFAEK